MVIRLSGQSTQLGPQPGPNPAWAHFTRSAGEGEGGTKVSLNTYKPDITAYRILGSKPVANSHGEEHRQRNAHNSSVYVSHVDRYRARPSKSLTRLPIVGEIAAG